MRGLPTSSRRRPRGLPCRGVARQSAPESSARSPPFRSSRSSFRISSFFASGHQCLDTALLAAAILLVDSCLLQIDEKEAGTHHPASSMHARKTQCRPKLNRRHTAHSLSAHVCAVQRRILPPDPAHPGLPAHVAICKPEQTWRREVCRSPCCLLGHRNLARHGQFSGRSYGRLPPMALACPRAWTMSPSRMSFRSRVSGRRELSDTSTGAFVPPSHWQRCCGLLKHASAAMPVSASERWTPQYSLLASAQAIPGRT